MSLRITLVQTLQLDEKTQALWDWFNGAPIHIVTILITAVLAQYLGSKAIRRAVGRLASADLIPGPRNIAFRQAERARTVGTVLSSTLNATIWIVALFMLLGELGLNLGPLIASAGVIGVALGLGAQTIVRDVLSGILMLIEDQFGVGDEVEVLDVKGHVEKVGLRITTVREKNGTLWYLRNGEILKVGNKSQSG
ncbi:MAG: hypothetical protein RL301_829 [Actinomycetota bacterium]